MDKKTLSDKLTKKMEGALQVFDHELNGLRTGRASVDLLMPITVDIYGSKMPINQVSTVTVSDAKTLSIQVWDQNMIKIVEKAIADSNLGLNPIYDGQLIRINIPPLNENRRKDIVKLAHKYGEDTKIRLRNIRRHSMEDLKKAEKETVISKDEQHKLAETVQKITDDFCNQADDRVQKKEKDLFSI